MSSSSTINKVKFSLLRSLFLSNGVWEWKVTLGGLVVTRVDIWPDGFGCGPRIEPQTPQLKAEAHEKEKMDISFLRVLLGFVVTLKRWSSRDSGLRVQKREFEKWQKGKNIVFFWFGRFGREMRVIDSYFEAWCIRRVDRKYAYPKYLTSVS